MARPRGTVQQAIVEYLKGKDAASVAQIIEGVTEQLGTVPASSVRSSLNLNVGTAGMLFERTEHGKYRLYKGANRGPCEGLSLEVDV